MGNDSSTPASNSLQPLASTPNDYNADKDKTVFSGESSSQNARSAEIKSLIHFAESNYESRPDESLSALMQAMTLNSGPVKASQAMRSIKAELERTENLGTGIHSGIFAQQPANGQIVSGANHNLTAYTTKQDKHHRVAQIVKSLLADRSTYLFQMGQQHILQQAMEDGSSIVCRRCNGMVPIKRWHQHQQYWCQAAANRLQTEVVKTDEDEMVLS
ncbi:MAG: hypothetical protein SGBAC_009306 [Bacillariaceae sp.]